MLSTIAPQLTDRKSEIRNLPYSLFGIPLYVYIGSLASILTVIGIMWDISWHITIGRDKLLAPPHLLIYAGAIFSGLFSVIQVLWNSFASNPETKKKLIKVWGIFYSSLGAMFCIWGAIAMLTSAPFDDWWHNTYGLDIKILSPPHALLGLGMMFLQLGAGISIIKYLNLQFGTTALNKWQHKRKDILQVLFVITAASLVCMVATFLKAPLVPRVQRLSLFYQTAATSFLLFLPAFGRAARMRWGMTAITFSYFLIAAITNWILQLFPGEPLLGPVLNPVTHFQPLSFPLLLFIPAIAMDFVTYRVKRNDWIMAALMSSIFIIGLVGIQYPFSGFLVESPSARNWFFGSEARYYAADPTWPFRYKFMKTEVAPLPSLIRGLGIAVLLGFVSARISLRWGKWMNNIVR